MSENVFNNERKKDGFIGERLIALPTEVFSNYVENPLVKRLFLTDVGYFPKAAFHYRERNEGSEEYIFMYCTEGKGIIKVNDKEYIVKKNEAFCIPRFQKHYYYASKQDPWSILWVHIKGEDTQFFPLEECRIVELGSNYATNRMMFLFELLFNVLDDDYTLGGFIYISQVLSLILSETYYRGKHEEKVNQNKHVTSIIRYMYSHLNENLTLEQLVKHSGLSKSYVNEIFLKCTKHSPMEFYIKLKMREACKLLRTSDMYVYEVAELVGYKDQYYFSRIFKKVVGIAPKEYKYSDYINYM